MPRKTAPTDPTAGFYQPGDVYRWAVEYTLADGSVLAAHLDYAIWSTSGGERPELVIQQTTEGEDIPSGPVHVVRLDDAGRWSDGAARGAANLGRRPWKVSRRGYDMGFDEVAASRRAAAGRDTWPGASTNIARLGAARTQVQATLSRIEEELRAAALAAVAEGRPKSAVAVEAGISRPTLDAWIKDTQ